MSEHGKTIYTALHFTEAQLYFMDSGVLTRLFVFDGPCIYILKPKMNRFVAFRNCCYVI